VSIIPRDFFTPLFADIDDLWRLQPADKQAARQQALWQPTCDIKDNGDDSFSIHVELPGVKKENIEIDLHDGALTVKGKKESASETKDEKGHWVRRERSFGSFQRRFNLPDGVEDKHVHAAFADGVLDIKVDKPKPETPKRAKIAVK
jgi:HSP20 family protein